jgi:hypothetical protein
MATVQALVVGGGGGGAGTGTNDYGAGGGGAGGNPALGGAVGTANTGGGGGGAGGASGGNAAGKAGGSGVVIFSYVTADFGACTGGTITTSGSDTIHTFTANGTFTVVAGAPSSHSAFFQLF